MSVDLTKRGLDPAIKFTTLQNRVGKIIYGENGFEFLGNTQSSSSDDSYTTFTGSSYSYRMGVRSNVFVIDKTITSVGFGGVEDTDWENIISFE